MAVPQNRANFVVFMFFVSSVEAFGSIITRFLREVGVFTLFILATFRAMIRGPIRRSLMWQQMEFVGNKSLTIILISSFFIGAAVSLQIGTIFTLFGAQGVVGAANAKATVRELSPLITGFLLAGRVGASMTAEIATMKVNEQLDAMDAMGIDPVSYLVVPRLLASVLMLPLLVLIFNVVSQVASFIISTLVFNIDQGLFFTKMVEITDLGDVFMGIQKSVVFGAVISLVACRFGLQAKGGAKGVGSSTTNSVINILIILLLIDFFMTYLQVVI